MKMSFILYRYYLVMIPLFFSFLFLFFLFDTNPSNQWKFKGSLSLSLSLSPSLSLSLSMSPSHPPPANLSVCTQHDIVKSMARQTDGQAGRQARCNQLAGHSVTELIRYFHIRESFTISFTRHRSLSHSFIHSVNQSVSQLVMRLATHQSISHPPTLFYVFICITALPNTAQSSCGSYVVSTRVHHEHCTNWWLEQ